MCPRSRWRLAMLGVAMEWVEVGGAGCGHGRYQQQHTGNIDTATAHIMAVGILSSFCGSRWRDGRESVFLRMMKRGGAEPQGRANPSRSRGDDASIPSSQTISPTRSCRPDEGAAELPVWRQKLSFRGQPYRYGHHQNGVMGHFQVRVVAAAEIPGLDWSVLARTDRALPYVAVTLGHSRERTAPREAESDSMGRLRATWPKELLSVEALKGQLPAGQNVYLGVQVYHQDNVVQSVLSSAVSTVMGSQGSLLGTGRLDVSPLLSGGVHLIDTWVELMPRGRVHLHVEYEPKGIHPGPNDVVFLESFARWEESLVIPQRAPMVVLYKRPPFLLVAFDTFTGREGRVRLHRNCVSVVERLSWLDVALTTVARPVDALLRTDSGSWLVRRSKPLLRPVLVMVAPLQASLLVAFATLKVALRGMVMGTQAVYQESVMNS